MSEDTSPAPLTVEQKKAEFVRLIADGGTWATACKALGISSYTPTMWLREDDNLARQYAHAREAQADAFADEIIEVARNSTLDPSHARVRIDALKWAAGKRKPKVYGDKLAIGGADDLPAVKIETDPARVAQATLLLIAQAKKANASDAEP